MLTAWRQRERRDGVVLRLVRFPVPPPSMDALYDAIFAAVLAAYKSSSRAWCSTLNKFAEVRLRGRKRSMVG